MALQTRRANAFSQQANELVRANMKDEGFGVSELANVMNMSRTTLYRKIKTGTGQSVSQFIRNARLNRALELLENEPLTVAEAAYITGFRNASYFSKCFRETFGYPPVEVIKRTYDIPDLEDHTEGDSSEDHRSLLHSFPVQTTSFIGREKEIGIIIDLIGKHRIVTMTGTGGCGKTRLACEVAALLLKDYPDGLWFVDLAPLESEELVLKQLMTTLGLTEAPGRDMMEIVVDSIRDKKLLILLDNCEHLLRTCAELAKRLIEAVPGLSLLATSREAFNINGEKVWIIPSLSMADPTTVIDIEQAERSEAVRLFIDRARMNNQGFELVEKNAATVSSICHMLDGMPLAIELVSCRTRHMDTITMLDRLSERFDSLPSLDPGTSGRHRTIEAAIDWSYNLLLEDEKKLFRQLSVFAGGFNLNAVEEVCSNENMQGERILDLLSQLVEKSMIQTVYRPGQQMRYKLLETLHRYASNLLIEKGEAEVARLRHLAYFTRMAENAYQEQFQAQSIWTNRLDEERDNLLSALNWSEYNSPENFAELASFLPWYWRVKSELSTGLDYVERALAKTTGLSKTHARALFGKGLFTWISGDSKSGVNYMLKSLEIWRKLEIPGEIAIALSEISEPLLHSGEPETSLKYSEEGLEIARELGNPGLINHCLIYYCINLVHTKHYEQGKALLEELLLSSEKLENIYGIESALHLIGDCTVGMKDFKEGEIRYAQGIETSLKYGGMAYVAFDTQGVAFALAGQGRWAKAIRLDAAAREQFKKLGMVVDGMVGFWDEWIDTYIEGAKKEVGKELTFQYQQEGIKMGLERALEYALDFNLD